jgi:putative phage-type endonuclease
MGAARDLLKEYMSQADWLAWRRRGIGSSDASTVMGVSKWSTPFELFLERTGRTLGRRRHAREWEAMQRGIRLEPEARRSYENFTGLPMLPGVMLVHPQYPQLRANLDGLNREEGRVLEIKCAGRADHKTAMKGKIPKHYFWQCVHLLMVSGMEWLDYYSYDGEGGGVTITMRRDPALEAQLMAAELAFWDLVLKDHWPPWEVLESNVIPIFKGGKTMQTYTADEVKDMLSHAKGLGTHWFKIPGFEVTFAMGGAPVQVKPQAAPMPERESAKETRKAELGKFVTTFGKKYRGWPLSRIGRKDMKEYGEYLLADTNREDLNETVREWLDRAEEYLELA